MNNKLLLETLIPSSQKIIVSREKHDKQKHRCKENPTGDKNIKTMPLQNPDSHPFLYSAKNG